MAPLAVEGMLVSLIFLNLKEQ